jgi:hypothetical protein
MTKRFRKILPNFLSMSPDRIISCRRHALTSHPASQAATTPKNTRAMSFRQ